MLLDSVDSEPVAGVKVGARSATDLTRVEGTYITSDRGRFRLDGLKCEAGGYLMFDGGSDFETGSVPATELSLPAPATPVPRRSGPSGGSGSTPTRLPGPGLSSSKVDFGHRDRVPTPRHVPAVTLLNLIFAFALRHDAIGCNPGCSAQVPWVTTWRSPRTTVPDAGISGWEISVSSQYGVPSWKGKVTK